MTNKNALKNIFSYSDLSIKIYFVETKKCYFVLTSKDNGYNYSDIFKKGIATFSQQNLKVKNCFICRYHAENNSWQYFEDTTGVPIFCKFLKIKCNSNQAVSCEYFKLEKNYVQEIITTIQEYDSEMEQYYKEIDESRTDDENWDE